MATARVCYRGRQDVHAARDHETCGRDPTGSLCEDRARRGGIDEGSSNAFAHSTALWRSTGRRSKRLRSMTAPTRAAPGFRDALVRSAVMRTSVSCRPFRWRAHPVDDCSTRHDEKIGTERSSSSPMKGCLLESRSRTPKISTHPLARPPFKPRTPTPAGFEARSPLEPRQGSLPNATTWTQKGSTSGRRSAARPRTLPLSLS